MKRFSIATGMALIMLIISGPAFAATSGVSVNASKGIVLVGDGLANCNTGNKGGIRYNSINSVPEFCNGTAWTPLSQSPSGSPASAPAGSAYFVLTKTTYTGNLGGLAGADADCLTDLTTNTGWKGYAAANSSGLLVAAKVHAFLCAAAGACDQILTPLTTYYFANANDLTAGGGYFTTDVNGIGPNDSVPWAAANRFQTQATYWTGMGGTGTGESNTNWGTAYTTFGCSTWTSTAASGEEGVSVATDTGRWRNALLACTNTLPLICVVNP